MIIADDFVLEKGSEELEEHKSMWKVPGFDLKNKTVICLEQKGFTVNQHELTSSVPIRSKALLSILIFLVRLGLFIAPVQHRLKLEIYLGGLLLEQLYNLRQVGYFVLIAHKKAEA